jgi:hypothetical protein
MPSYASFIATFTSITVIQHHNNASSNLSPPEFKHIIHLEKNIIYDHTKTYYHCFYYFILKNHFNLIDEISMYDLYYSLTYSFK